MINHSSIPLDHLGFIPHLPTGPLGFAATAAQQRWQGPVGVRWPRSKASFIKQKLLEEVLDRLDE
jgi:hypothetical protein